MVKPHFTVDESIDPKVAREALADLHRMILYGRMAERAMKSIREHGYYDGLTPLAETATSNYEGQYSHGKKKADVRFARLPMRLPISRADLGPMSELRLELGRVENTKYSGNACKEIPLMITGPMATQMKSGLPVYEIQESRRKIGLIRINKGHLSWIGEPGYGQDGGAQRIYKEMKYPGAQEALAAFSKGVSKMLVIRHNEVDDVLVYAAKTLELQATAWKWFLADGYAEKFFRDIHELVRVVEVMDS